MAQCTIHSEKARQKVQLELSAGLCTVVKHT